MSSFYYGEGQALLVCEECNTFRSLVKPFTSSSIITPTDDIFSKILQYENSIIGKKLLAGTITTNPFNIIASDGMLNYIFIPFIFEDRSGIIIYITGIYKKESNYCSREIQYFIPSDTNNIVLNNNFCSVAIREEEFNKLLEDDPLLKQLYQKLNNINN